MDRCVRKGNGVSNGEEWETYVKDKKRCRLKKRLGQVVEDLQDLMVKMSRSM